MPNAPLSLLAVAAVAVAPLVGAALDPLDEPWLQSAKLTSDPPEARGSIGLAIAASSDRVLLGAPGEGAAYVFEQGGSGWVQAARLAVVGLPSGFRFGDAVALHAGAAFVAAPGASSIFVFHRDADGDWVLVQTLSPWDPGAGARFGASLATDGNRLVVGAPYTPSAAGGRTGAVHVYAGVGGTLVLEQVLTADLGALALLGHAVAVRGDGLAAGAAGAGTVLLYTWAGGAWERSGVVASSTPNDGFGRAVALGGDALAVGALSESTGDGPRTGAVHVYERGGGGWSHVAHLLPGDLAPFKWRPGLGTSLAMSPGGDLLAVGAPGDDVTPAPPGAVAPVTDPACFSTPDSPTCRTPGAVYLYRPGPGGWHQVAKLTALDAAPVQPSVPFGNPPALGHAVALEPASGAVVAGAPFADVVPGDDAGAAYVFTQLDLGVVG